MCGNSNSLFYTLLSAINRQHRHTLAHYQSKFEDLTLAYGLQLHGGSQSNTTTSPNDRYKRFSWDTFDFLEDIPVLGHVYQIIKSPHENKKLKRHVLQLQQKFNQFAQDTIKHLKQSRTFEDQILKLIDNELDAVYDHMSSIKCDVTALASLFIYQQSVLRTHLKVSELFYQVRHGKLLSESAPTLTLEDLRKIVTGNPNFQNSIYEQNPELIFRLGDIVLVDTSQADADMTFHFILVIPKISQQSLYQTYKVAKSPISKDMNSPCYLTYTSPVLFYKDGLFYSTDTSECSTRNEIIMCLQDFGDQFTPNLIQPEHCLNNKPEQCMFTPASCESKLTFTRGGALIFSKGQILAMRRDLSQRNKLSVVSSNLKFTYFLPWEKYILYAQAGTDVIYALDNSIIVRNISKPSPDYFEKLYQNLQNTTLTYNNQNVSTLRSQIQETSDLLYEDYKVEILGAPKRRFLDYINYITWGITFVTGIFFVTRCVCKRTEERTGDLIRATLTSLVALEQRNTRPTYTENPISEEHLGLTLPTVVHTTLKPVLHKQPSQIPLKVKEVNSRETQTYLDTAPTDPAPTNLTPANSTPTSTPATPGPVPIHQKKACPVKKTVVPVGAASCFPSQAAEPCPAAPSVHCSSASRPPSDKIHEIVIVLPMRL